MDKLHLSDVKFPGRPSIPQKGQKRAGYFFTPAAPDTENLLRIIAPFKLEKALKKPWIDSASIVKAGIRQQLRCNQDRQSRFLM
jgi:hypothetical protein